MGTPYPEVYRLAGSMYETADSTAISTTTGDYGPGTELQMIQDPSVAHLGPPDMYSWSMSTSYPRVPQFAPGFMYGTENRTLAPEPVPVLNQYHSRGSEFGHVIWTSDNAQSGPIPPTVTPSAQASCPPALCRWRDGTGICHATISCKDISDHFRDAHDIKQLNESERIDCEWEGCLGKKKIGRKNFVRHIKEHHLKHSRGKGHAA